MSIIAQSVRATLFIALLPLAAACGGGGGECTPGTKGCACTASGACGQGLTCQAGKCVEGVAPGTGGSTTPATSAPKGSGGARGTGGVTGAGGTTSAGGATGTGGAIAVDGGATRGRTPVRTPPSAMSRPRPMRPRSTPRLPRRHR